MIAPVASRTEPASVAVVAESCARIPADAEIRIDSAAIAKLNRRTIVPPLHAFIVNSLALNLVFHTTLWSLLEPKTVMSPAARDALELRAEPTRYGDCVVVLTSRRLLSAAGCFRSFVRLLLIQ
jgi:hypothetical protein